MENHTRSYTWIYILLAIIIGATFNSYKSMNEKINKLEHYIGYLEDDLSSETTKLKAKIEELKVDINEIKYKLNIY